MVQDEQMQQTAMCSMLMSGDMQHVAGDWVQQQEERVHIAHHRHSWLASIPGNDATVHIQGPRIHTRLFCRLQTIIGGTGADHQDDEGDEGRGMHRDAYNAGGQQER